MIIQIQLFFARRVFGASEWLGCGLGRRAAARARAATASFISWRNVIHPTTQKG